MTVLRNKPLLTQYEAFLLQEMCRAAEPISSVNLSDAIQRETGREPRLATVYDKMLSLQERGLIRYAGKESTPGRPIRLYVLTDCGALAIQFAAMLNQEKTP